WIPLGWPKRRPAPTTETWPGRMSSIFAPAILVPAKTPSSDAQQELLFDGEDYRASLLCCKGSSMIRVHPTPRFNTGLITLRGWQACLGNGLIRGQDVGGGRVC